MKTPLVPTSADVRQAEVHEVIRVIQGIGAGIDGDPYRLVTHYYELDGTRLFCIDPMDAEAVRDRQGTENEKSAYDRGAGKGI